MKLITILGILICTQVFAGNDQKQTETKKRTPSSLDNKVVANVGGETVKRIVDAELGIVCYTGRGARNANLGLFCLPIPE